MFKKLSFKSLLAGCAALSMAAAPTTGFARDHDDAWRGERGGWNDGYRGNYRGYDRGYRDDNDDDALAAGLIGLALGAALGAALSNPEPRYQGPPQRYYNAPPHDGYQDGYRDGERAPVPYYGQGQCFRRELVWDPRSRRNIEVTTPFPC